ncbi:barstar family protein [Kitasatospora purpeofusca]|uniref:barstar family protein n=1 Tax=Kitasatospora purpeofusca TaxID=67352 RepID=UPI00367F8349
MQSVDHATWGHGFPVKYLLGQVDAELEIEYWGRCADVDGLFVDPVPPPREVLTIRGCNPEGPWHDVIARPGEATRSLGTLEVAIWDEHQPQFVWDLVDTVVIAHWPNAADPGLVDIVVGTGVIEHAEVWWGAGPGTMPTLPRFEIHALTYRGGQTGACLGIDGLLAPRATPADTPLRLIGCEPGAPMLAALRDRRAWTTEWAALQALNRAGEEMARRMVRLEIADVRPSVLGAPLLDITLADGGDDDRPPLAARHIWETWYRGHPNAPDQWAALDTQGRTVWLELTRRHPGGPDSTGGTHHLAGRFITDLPGLYCALGEALIGPGFNIGRGWDDLKDCLRGERGIVGPFTLIWHDADIARRALGFFDGPGRSFTSFERILQLLERHHVNVVLE